MDLKSSCLSSVLRLPQCLTKLVYFHRVVGVQTQDLGLTEEINDLDPPASASKCWDSRYMPPCPANSGRFDDSDKVTGIIPLNVF